jgi:hypothetical protein
MSGKPVSDEPDFISIEECLTEAWDFHYRLCARFDPATGGAEKNFRAATAD